MSSSRDHIERLYRQHPLTRDSIRARLIAARGSLEHATEEDLAHDPRTEITDQNHVGGAAFAESLGIAAGVGPRSLVADVGCGLGGTARVLASRFGCRVEGLDLSRRRVADARALTRLVGLERLVRIRSGDMTRVRVPASRYDVVIGQAAWVHVRNKDRLVQRWSRGLRRGGRLAVEDACLLRSPRTRMERVALARLEENWAATLVRPGTWADLCRGHGLDVFVEDDLSAALLEYYVALRDGARRGRLAVAREERQSWRDAIHASQDGLIGYLRLVARRGSR